jgi:hypothetical protein
MCRLPESTVVVLTGNALGMIKQACEIARALEPALVVVEEVDLIERMEGVTASFIKELIRRAALIAAEERAGAGSDPDSSNGAAAASSEQLRVSAVHLDAALDILAGSRHQLTRRLLGAPDQLHA